MKGNRDAKSGLIWVLQNVMAAANSMHNETCAFERADDAFRSERSHKLLVIDLVDERVMNARKRAQFQSVQ